MTRVLVCGPPRCGKTTFSLKIAARMGLDELAVQHGDDLVGVLPWSEAGQMVSWISGEGPWCIEGVSAVRALRKWVLAHPGDEKPCDVLYLLTSPFREWKDGERTMAKGHATIFFGIESEVRRRGVVVRLCIDDMRGL